LLPLDRQIRRFGGGRQPKVARNPPRAIVIY